uniref:Uncharacterized protein n=1 Tax=Parascaris univalens TaxID=6257 RepID=A0A914ZDN9_PARUN
RFSEVEQSWQPICDLCTLIFSCKYSFRWMASERYLHYLSLSSFIFLNHKNFLPVMQWLEAYDLQISKCYLHFTDDDCISNTQAKSTQSMQLLSYPCLKLSMKTLMVLKSTCKRSSVCPLPERIYSFTQDVCRAVLQIISVCGHNFVLLELSFQGSI